ncbi:MAG TPA: GntR family transcriptional regulator [Arthrobacter sp.]|nr:GntR family transcriptional regulator [Arthrobacter sp.]
MGSEVPSTRRAAISRQLRDEILAGELPPGAPIKDAELAERLGVSITPVREAVTELITEGLIESLPNKRRQVAVLNELHAVQLLDVLGVVLVAVFERSAARLGQDDIEAMAAAAERLEDALQRSDMLAAHTTLLELIEIILDAADHDELRAVNEHVLARSLGRLFLYQREDLYYIWTDGWKEAVALLHRQEPDAAVQRLRQVFWILTEELRTGDM